MKLVQRLAIGGLSLVAVGALLTPNAAASVIPTWQWSGCTSETTWAGLFGLNNDEPAIATITAVTVSNGVAVPGLTVGTTIAAHADLERTATGLSTSVASFTVNITLAWPVAAGIAPMSRTQVVSRPASCVPATSTTTASTVPASSSSTATTTVAPTSSTSASSTSSTSASSSTSAGAATTTTTKPATTVAANSSGTGSKPTVLAVVQTPDTVKLPVTGRSSGRVSLLAAAVLVAGVTLVSVSRIGRPSSVKRA